MKLSLFLFILLTTFNFNFFLIKCSVLEKLGLKIGKINIFRDDQEQLDDKLITLKLSHLLKQFGYYPDQLIDAAKTGDTISLRQFRTLIRENISQHVSIACVGDLLYFVDSLLETALAQYDLSNSCVRDGKANCSCAKRIDDTIKENSWTLDVLDSLGKIPAGLLTGNFWMLGDFEECVQISVPKSSPKHKWNGQYCRVDVSLFANKLYEDYTKPKDRDNIQDQCSGAYSFKYGTCFPSTCSQADVQAIVEFGLNLPQKLSDKRIVCDTKVYCHRELEITKDTYALVVIFCLIFIAFITLFGTVYDYFVYQKLVQNVTSVIHIVVRKESEKQQIGRKPSIYLETQNQFYAKQPWLVKVLISFSVYTNGKKLFDTRQKPGQIHCIHGIRVLSMLWIILGHSYYTSWNYIDNPLGIVTEMVEVIYNHMLINSTVSTDTFYLLSGTLIAYLWLKEMKKTNGKNVLNGKLWIMYYVHRYVRLTPVYLVVLAIHALLIRYVTDGPLWDQNGIDSHGCANSWWTNLLYVNNFFWLKEQCMTWTWYLANDFQFYAFAPPFLIILWKKNILGLTLIGVLILSTSILRMSLIIAHDKWPPIAILLNDLSLATIIDGFWKQIYMKPYCRCGPFLVGLILGHVLYKSKLKVNMPKWASCIGWMMSTSLALGVLFGLYEYSKTTYISFAGLVIYAAFGRVLWSVAISWVIFACSTGHGSSINSFLSCKFWIPLSRLVYCTYLIHPLLIYVFYTSQMRPAHYSGHFVYVTFFLTNVLISFCLALLFTLMFEIPIIGLEKFIFQRNHDERLHGKMDQAYDDKEINSTEDKL